MCDLKSAEDVSGASRPLGPGTVLQGGGTEETVPTPREVRGAVAGGPGGGSDSPSSELHFLRTDIIYIVMPE